MNLTPLEYSIIERYVETGRAPVSEHATDLLFRALLAMIADRDRWQAECVELRDRLATTEAALAYSMEATMEQARKAEELASRIPATESAHE